MTSLQDWVLRPHSDEFFKLLNENEPEATTGLYGLSEFEEIKKIALRIGYTQEINENEVKLETFRKLVLHLKNKHKSEGLND